MYTFLDNEMNQFRVTADSIHRIDYFRYIDSFREKGDREHTLRIYSKYSKIPYTIILNIFEGYIPCLLFLGSYRYVIVWSMCGPRVKPSN